MSEHIEIWLVGNTGLRNPNRIQEGFSVFANSCLRWAYFTAEKTSLALCVFWTKKGIIQNEDGKDSIRKPCP